jgi:hypothetical protein
VSEFLEAQGRFSHLSAQAIASIQSHVDERWDLLVGLEARNESGRSIAKEDERA